MSDQTAQETEAAINAVAGSTVGLMAVALKQGPTAIISLILCWGVFVSIPNIVQTFSDQQDKMRAFFLLREDAQEKSRTEEFKQIIVEQRELTKTLGQTNELLREQQQLLRSAVNKPGG